MRIEILCTGDEVLSGKTINTNYSHMARRLQEVGLDVVWGTTVGDERASLVEAFARAAERADAVIVNGGLGPTVDDLSQEVAAEAAGVGLVLNEGWLEQMEGFYKARGREMPPNNRKQAMLPEGAELVDNPVGTACGFAIDIGRDGDGGGARFFFTPGVPRELRRMLDDEVIPRLLSLSGTKDVVVLQRFHSFGLGESRVDNLLAGVEDLAEGGEVKLGFQAHYPQLETKLLAKGPSEAEIRARLAPVEARVRDTLGAYLLCEGADTLEGVLLGALDDRTESLAIAECGTHGAIAGRLLALDTEGKTLRRAAVGARPERLAGALGLPESFADQAEPLGAVAQLAGAVRATSATSLGLAVWIHPGEKTNEGWVHIAVAAADGSVAVQRTSCIVGGAERVRVGGVELGLDVLRRYIQGLPTGDLIDFEKH